MSSFRHILAQYEFLHRYVQWLSFEWYRAIFHGWKFISHQKWAFIRSLDTQFTCKYLMSSIEHAVRVLNAEPHSILQKKKNFSKFKDASNQMPLWQFSFFILVFLFRKMYIFSMLSHKRLVYEYLNLTSLSEYRMKFWFDDCVLCHFEWFKTRTKHKTRIANAKKNRMLNSKHHDTAT